MRKLQMGNRWKTQFVTLHREEVRRLQEYEKRDMAEYGGNSVQEYLANFSTTNRTDRVTMDDNLHIRT